MGFSPPFLYRDGFRLDNTTFIGMFLVGSHLTSTKQVLPYYWNIRMKLFQVFVSATYSSSDCREPMAKPTQCPNVEQRGKHWAWLLQIGVFTSRVAFKKQLYTWGDPWL